jgi:hypothetical protein
METFRKELGEKWEVAVGKIEGDLGGYEGYFRPRLGTDKNGLLFTCLKRSGAYAYANFHLAFGMGCCGMVEVFSSVPDNVEVLKALVVAARAEGISALMGITAYRAKSDPLTRAGWIEFARMGNYYHSCGQSADSTLHFWIKPVFQDGLGVEKEA